MVLESPGCGKKGAFLCDTLSMEEECVDESQLCNGISECLNGRDESIEVCGEYLLFLHDTKQINVDFSHIHCLYRLIVG